MALNGVIAGDYKHKKISSNIYNLNINVGFRKKIPITKETVEAYEIVDEDNRKKASSAIGRGLVGSLALGPVGLLAGLSAKTKTDYLIAIRFKDGKESLIDINNLFYNMLVKSLF